ncbi:MAG: pyrroloquinoline quinone-dependent dehydrogenase [Alphaproteobacteria bacterium]|nr:pyrroloquinoline quinone-dependent dehydrogenase [Alphaproteobacteria bacterium]
MLSGVRIIAILLVALSSARTLAANDWEHVGGDAGGQRFSEARELTRENVAGLEVAWTISTGELKDWGARRGWKFQTTPILFEGNLVFCTTLNDVVAVDPGSGRTVWRFDANLPDIEPAGNGYACRGVTAWRDPVATPGAACASRIFTGTNDYRLIALDAATGRPCIGFGDAGRIKLDPGVPLVHAGEFQITSPPVVARGVVLVGSAIGDGVRVAAPSGKVRAFDARTGVPRWTFDPVPRDPADPARASWGAGSDDRTGHANVWSLMSADEARGLFFVPTSSPSVDHYGGTRPGENRYANSVVALDAVSGKVVWHFQTVHHDLWDYDVAAQPSLVVLRRDGKEQHAVVQPTKMGLIFTLDRATGTPVFDVEERPVPKGDVPGEWYSPTQPFPVAPRMLVPAKLKADDAWGVTFLDRWACQSAIAGVRNQGIYTPPSLQGSLLYPFISGGVNWGSASFDRSRQTLYVLTNNASGFVQLIPRADVPPRNEMDVFNDGIASQTGTPYVLKRSLLASPLGAPCNPPPWGQIHAIDMTTGAVKWERPLGTLEDVVPFGDLWLPHGSGNLGGPIGTATGLIFVAATMDNYLRALDADTGRELWKGRLPAGGQATPMTYVWKGRQYVVVAAGGHDVIGTTRGDTIIAFALPKMRRPHAR